MLARLFGSKKLQAPVPAAQPGAAPDPRRHQAFLAEIDQRMEEFIKYAVSAGKDASLRWDDEGLYDVYRWHRLESADEQFAYFRSHMDFPSVPPDFVNQSLYGHDRSAVLNPHLKMTHIESLDLTTAVTRHQIKLFMFKVDSFVVHVIRVTPHGTCGVQMAVSSDLDQATWKFEPHPQMYLNMTGSIIQPHPTEAGGSRLTLLHKEQLKWKSFLVPRKVRKELSLKILTQTMVKMDKIVKDDFAEAAAGRAAPPPAARRADLGLNQLPASCPPAAPATAAQLGAAAAAKGMDLSRPSTGSTSRPGSMGKLTFTAAEAIEGPGSGPAPAPAPAEGPVTGSQLLTVSGVRPENLGAQIQEMMDVVTDALVAEEASFDTLDGLASRKGAEPKKPPQAAAGVPAAKPQPPPARLDAHEQALPGSIA